MIINNDMTTIFICILIFLCYYHILVHVHELGHTFALIITSKNIKFDNLVIRRNYNLFWIVFSYGKTDSNLYEHLSNNKHLSKYAFFIRFNALSGFVSEVVCHILISIILLCLKLVLPFVVCQFFFIISFYLFCKSNDLKYFKEPALYDYMYPW